MAWAQTLQDTAPAPVASVQAIQPLDAETPREIVTPRAIGAGTLRVTLFELWNGPIWTQLGSDFADSGDILDIFKKQVSLGAMKLTKVMKRPTGAPRSYTYSGCVISDVDDGETINLGTTVMPKSITFMYTRRLMN